MYPHACFKLSTLGAGCGDAFNHCREKVGGFAAFEQCIGSERNAVAQSRQRDLLDVVRRHVVSAVEKRDHARGSH